MKTEEQIVPSIFLPLGELSDPNGPLAYLLVVGLILFGLSAASERHSLKTDVPKMRKPDVASDCLELNDVISCFQSVKLHTEDYPNVSMWAKHIRPESSNVDFSVLVTFRAFNTSFRIHLYQSLADNARIFDPHAPVTMMSSRGRKTLYRSDLKIIFFRGYLIDKPLSSFVHGTVQIDNFDFIIKTQTENYYIEPSRKYLHLNLENHNASVVYRSSDIRQFPGESKLDGCFKIPHAIVLKNESHVKSKIYQSRHKRHRTKKFLKDPSRTCRLCAVIDHTFFQAVGLFSVEKTMAEVVHAVLEADLIFRLTDFDNDTLGDNIGFVISDVRIYETVDVPEYFLRRMDLEASSLLVEFSRYNFDDFCLSLLFTFRDFSGRVLGLAWASDVGDRVQTGGICHKRMYTSPGDNVAPGFFNFNTLLVSYLSNGGYVHRKVIALTVTHELGHAFGATHDDLFENDICTSSQRETYGDYIMFSKAPRHNRLLQNNYRFSDCSKVRINAMVNSWGSACFDSYPFPVCGNMILEVGEDCDCGSEMQCSIIDPCCRPPSILNREMRGCRYYSEHGSVCSPQTDLCCNSECRIIPSSPTVVCREATECMEESVCNGLSSSCPTPRPKRHYSQCANGFGVCSREGICSKSVCAVQGLVDCQCTFTFSALCKLCCGCSAESQICLPAEWLAFFRTKNSSIFSMALAGDSSLYLAPGSHCNNNNGFCNANNICI